MLPLIGIEPQEVKVKVNLRKKIWIDKKKAKNKTKWSKRGDHIEKQRSLSKF